MRLRKKDGQMLKSMNTLSVMVVTGGDGGASGAAAEVEERGV